MAEKISIIGAGISGIGAAKLALQIGAKVFISDTKPADKLSVELKNADLLGRVEFEGGGNTDRIYDADLIVVSPAVWRTAQIFTEAKKRSIEVIGELEFAYRQSRCRWIAITGSTGKSSTTAMLNAIFDATAVCDGARFIPHCLCGNIGFSAAQLAPKLPENGVAICEVSSFQLETIKDFCPTVAVILNLYPNHLDRHKSLDEYYSTKRRIYENMRTGLVITDSKIEIPNGNFQHLKFNSDDDKINIPVAAAAAKYFGIDDETINAAINNFTGLEHRMEFVGEKNFIRFYNDSKSTTGESMLAAISGFAEKNVYLLVGGRDKGVPFEDYRDEIYKHCAAVFSIGEASGRIKECWGEIVEECGTLERAIYLAERSAKAGGVVILSPACSSFDQFRNFEERGDKFKEIVKNL